jgi:hypothetical protein
MPPQQKTSKRDATLADNTPTQQKTNRASREGQINASFNLYYRYQLWKEFWDPFWGYFKFTVTLDFRFVSGWVFQRLLDCIFGRFVALLGLSLLSENLKTLKQSGVF